MVTSTKFVTSGADVDFSIPYLTSSEKHEFRDHMVIKSA
jgi:hypothetical protein